MKIVFHYWNFRCETIADYKPSLSTEKIVEGFLPLNVPFFFTVNKNIYLFAILTTTLADVNQSDYFRVIICFYTIRDRLISLDKSIYWIMLIYINKICYFVIIDVVKCISK